MKIAVLFRRLGPYHCARLQAAGNVADVHCVEGSGIDHVYAWDRVDGARSFKRVTLLPSGDAGTARAADVKRAATTALTRIKPDVVAIPGWETALALSGLRWALDNGRPVVTMADSIAPPDGYRKPVKNWIKRQTLGLSSACFVSGTASADYVCRLGMARSRVFHGYDVVDNDYFRKGADAVRRNVAAERENRGLPKRFFLCSARFIPEKNLERLLVAYACYRKQWTAQRVDGAPWDLVLLGDGPARNEVCREVTRLALGDVVHRVGFRQYDELPAFYALASALVLPSVSETWGLVVNEAMACGLPVLVSRQCGCARDLVIPDRNGYVFDPTDVAQISDALYAVASRSETERAAMGVAGQAIIEKWSPELFAEGLIAASKAATQTPVPPGKRFAHGVLDIMLRIR